LPRPATLCSRLKAAPDGTTGHLTKAASCQVIGHRNDGVVWITSPLLIEVENFYFNASHSLLSSATRQALDNIKVVLVFIDVANFLLVMSTTDLLGW